MTTTENYSETWGISQSAIKDFEKMSPLEWKKIWIDKEKKVENKSTFLFGTVLDILLFTPESFDSKFYVADLILPSEAIVSIIDAFYTKLKIKNTSLEEVNKELPYPVEIFWNLKDQKELLLECIKNYTSVDDKTGDVKYGWQNNWKEDTRIEKVIEQGNGYYNLLLELNGKIIISSKLKQQADNLKNILLNHSLTKDWFIPQEGIELIFQHEIFVDEKGELPKKLSIDIKRIDHNKKTEQIADFKTAVSAFLFSYSIKKYGYCRQLSFYNYYDNKLEGYTRLNPINIVIDLKEQLPYIYEHSIEDLNIEIYGSIQHKLKGWLQIVEEITWHFQNSLWEYPKEIYENNKIKLKLYD